MLYKIIHRFVELSLPNYIIPAPCCTRRNSTKFIQLMTSIDSYKFSFFPYSITQWNKLPDHVVNTTYIPVRGWIKETARAYIQLNPSALGFNWIYTRHQWLRDAKENIPYRTKVWREKSLAKHVKQSIWRIKFGENVTILTIVVEL